MEIPSEDPQLTILAMLTRNISVSSAADLESRIVHSLTHCTRMLHADKGLILLLCENQQGVWIRCAYADAGNEFLVSLFGNKSPEEYAIWEGMQHPKNVFQMVDALQASVNSSREKQFFIDFDIRSYLQIPIGSNGSFIGFMAFTGSQPGKEWPSENIAFVQDVAIIKGLLLHEIRQKSGVESRPEARSSVLKPLKTNIGKESLAFYPDTGMLESLNFGVAVFECSSGKFLFNNGSFAELLNYTRKGNIKEEWVFRHFRENGYVIKDLFLQSGMPESREFSLHMAGRYLSGSISPLEDGRLLVVSMQDITPVIRYEKSEKVLNRQLQKLSQTAVKLIQPDDSDIYRFIGESAISLFPDAIVVVNSYNARESCLQTRYASGLSAPIETIAKLLGSHPVNKKYPLSQDSEAYRNIVSNFVSEVKGGIAELSLGMVAAPLAHKIEKLLKTSKYYVCGLFFNDKLYGSLTVMFRSGATAHPFVLETYARMVSGAMKSREMGHEILEKETRFSSLVKQSHDAIVIMNDEGVITEFNESAEALSGLSAADAMGKFAWDMEQKMRFRPDHLDQSINYSTEKLKRGFFRLFNPVCSTKRSSRGFIMELPGGQRRHLTVSSFVFHVGGQKYLCRISTDTTAEYERKEEEKQKEIQRRIDQAKSLFLDNMSHEMRTPLSGVIGMTDLLMRSGISEYQQELLSVVKDSSQSLLNLIAGIHQLSVIDTSGVVFKNKAFRVNELIENAVNMFKAAAFQKDIILDYTLNISHGNVLMGDTGRLNQVLTNLIANAVKFTPSGGHVWVETRTHPCKEAMVCLDIRVVDTGPGIPQEKLSRLFDRFFQVDDSFTREHDGAGIGLAISKELVNLMGGEIGVESQPGKGSTFRIKLSLPRE